MVARLTLVLTALIVVALAALWFGLPQLRGYLETRQRERTRREELRNERVDTLVEDAERERETRSKDDGS
jgi:membrane protein implicated in regulation of membrane protease activity